MSNERDIGAELAERRISELEDDLARWKLQCKRYEAMVEAAIENMAGASCIPDDDSPCMSPEYVMLGPDEIEIPGNPPLEICRKCCSDHLSAKAKEALSR